MRSHSLVRCLSALLFAAVLPLCSQVPATPFPNTTPAGSAVLPGIAPTTQMPLPAQAAPSPPAFEPTAEDIGDSMEARQRYQAAIAAYSQISNPSAAVWNKMGIAYQMMFNVRDAARCYKESLKFNPENPMVLNNLATLYDSQKKYSAAEKLYKKALKADPDSALILKNLGTNLLMQRKYDAGWKAYERAMKIDSSIFQSHAGPTVTNPTSVRDRGAMNYYMARGCVRMGETACALQYLRQAINEGYTTLEKLSKDADFASLMEDPAYKQMAAEIKQMQSSKHH